VNRSKEGSSELPHLIRSYNPKTGTADDEEPVNSTKMSIWEVARAATAAPMYFTELPYRFSTNDPSDKYSFADGGFGSTNNPTFLGIDEITRLYPHGRLGVVLSVGTARADATPGRKDIFHRVKMSFDKATSPRIVAEQVRRLGLEHYWRLNSTSETKDSGS
jgi:patatin-like phospholipase/acyl hydrolase